MAKSAIQKPPVEKPIQRRRKNRRMTQAGLASLLGVSTVHLCNIENGRSDPSLVLLRRMAVLLKCRIRDLL